MNAMKMNGLNESEISWFFWTGKRHAREKRRSYLSIYLCRIELIISLICTSAAMHFQNNPDRMHPMHIAYTTPFPHFFFFVFACRTFYLSHLRSNRRDRAAVSDMYHITFAKKRMLHVFYIHLPEGAIQQPYHHDPTTLPYSPVRFQMSATVRYPIFLFFWLYITLINFLFFLFFHLDNRPVVVAGRRRRHLYFVVEGARREHPFGIKPSWTAYWHHPPLMNRETRSPLNSVLDDSLIIVFTSTIVSINH